jgi:hypothetical protein
MRKKYCSGQDEKKITCPAFSLEKNLQLLGRKKQISFREQFFHHPPPPPSEI